MVILDWKPDKSSPIPLYIQIKEWIKEKIENGEWTVGNKIPTQRAMAKSFGVNRSTVVWALEELMADGLIEGKRGNGTKVVNNTWSLLTTTPPPDWNSYLKAGIHKPNLPTIQEINKAEFFPNIIRLGTGELSPDLFPLKMFKQVLNYLPNRINSLGYEEPKGLLFLREQLSHYLKRFNINVSPASILIVSGSIQALQLISLGLLHRGSTIFLEKPSYLYSLHVFQSAGMNLWGIPLDKTGLKTTVISQHKKRKNASLLYTIPTFHNPTGTLMSEKKRKELMLVCEQQQLPVIEDDVYRELWIDSPPPDPLKALDKNGLVLYLGSMSKTLSPGLRIGWLVGPEPVIEHLADIKMQTDYGASSLSQWTAAEWIASGLYFEHLETVRKQLKIRRETALNTLEKYFGSIGTWQVPKGGFYIWIKLNKSISIGKLFGKALQEGILLNPGSLYDGNDHNHLRISYSYASLSELETGLSHLANIIKA